MMKAQQKIIKKGDYYEIQAYEETMMLISKSKRQQTPIVSSTNIPVSQYIVTEVPTFKNARQNYFSASQNKQKYSHQNLNQLKVELQILANQDNLNDQDRKQIQKLMEQIDSFRDSKQVALNSLSQVQEPTKSQAKSSQYNKINLTAKYNVQSLTNRLQQLQKLDFPQLHNLQHQLQIMLGQKKPLQTVQLQALDQRQKQQLTNIYNHLNNLTILNNISGTVDTIALNQDKHVQMQSWIEKNERISNFHNDFLKELKQDTQIVEKLEKNFKTNMQQVKLIVQQLKSKK